MLDTDTKRRIDTARDILVGKLPDPKSQVEQITIALIYKFMDDMDAEAEELGGRRKFFYGDYARYGWAKLMRSGLGGHETLNLYAEAIAKMPENPGIPPLFRDIFKNAFLPYRDPETLRAFLKVIDEFQYDHSERLGDAFEYLLSVLGSQGDAGQFRTPRHIIDFIVDIVDPKKTETVLDPACGTAGFLISSYKHILKANIDAEEHSTLTPDERGRLATNFMGYDISPDMVRLSLVNLYLHGFTDPHIHEYDTLTSQDRWNEYADVIFANPPFMSPKGGIKPHNRFSVQSKRSEVLFVDYIAEHLTPNGRAGIIVPEGIIFQSQGAYTQLRKMLVEDYLVAVISLPAGVFNPYSGVKTSVLILDKSLAKQADTIAFFRIDHDGFGLGAQRRPIDKDDLPEVRAEITKYLRDLRAHESVDDFQPAHGLIVTKENIATGGEYNLSLERYRGDGARVSRFPIVSIGDVAQVIAGQSPPGESYNELSIGTPFYQGKTEFGQTFIGAPTKWTTQPLRFAENDDVLMSVRAPVGPVNIATQKICIGRGLAAIRATEGRLLAKFLFYVLRSIEHKITGDAGAAFASINRDDIEKIKIPLPPLDIQKEIVAEIDGYQRIIDGAQSVVDGYQPHIPPHPDWPVVAIKDVAAVESGYGFPLDYQGKTSEEIPFLKVSDMNLPGNEKMIVRWNHTVSRASLRELGAEAHPPGTVIFPKIGAAIGTNKKRILSRASTYDNNVMGIVPNQKNILSEYLYSYLLGFDLSRWASDSQPPSMRKTTVEAHKIPLPTMEVQKALVAEIAAEQVLVDANRELIKRFQKKIQESFFQLWRENELVGEALADG